MKINKNDGIDAIELDENMALKKSTYSDLKWLSPWEHPIYLAGFPWFPKDKTYCRLPVKPAYTIPDPVKTLSYCTAGGQMRFRTNSTKLEIDVKLTSPANMYHMPATGQCGFDCYISIPSGDLKYCGTTMYDHTQVKYRSTLYEDMEPEMREVIINFPLYQGVDNVHIGVDTDAKIEGPAPYATDRKAIFYGTSITQGGCASRPGMAYTNILSRWLNMECINLGFSGNGKGEPEVAHIISEIKNPSCLILDYDANCPSAEHLRDTLPKFIEIYRSVHENIPILVLSRIRYASYSHKGQVRLESSKRRNIQFETVKKFKAKGDDNIYFVDGAMLLGDQFEEMTVDGVHPTDLGFFNMAEKLYPILKTVLIM